MNKISKRIIKYMVFMNLIVIIVGLILTAFILPKIYINNEYSDLEKASEYVLEAAQSNTVTDLVNVYAVLIDDKEVRNMCKTGNSRGHMGQGGMLNKGGMMGQADNVGEVNSIDFKNIKGKQIFKSNSGNTYIGIKKSSDYGDIVVYKSYEEIKSLTKSVNLIIIAISLLSLAISTIIAIYLGEKFTKPIVLLQKRADDISKGIYGKDIFINTNDEIHELNNKINYMAKELEIKDNMQREFIANVSHDLKTPLSVIRANSEVIKDELISGKEVVEYASIIMDEVDLLTNLVGEILVLTKLKDNKIIKPIDCELNKFIEESYINLKNYLINDNYNNYHLELKIDKEIKDKEIIVAIDNIYLFRVLSNFFTNAIKHSKNINNNIIFGLESLGDDIEIYIEDYGCGIDKEKLGYIWDRYYKEDKSGGMGLGLAISKEIILSHGFDYKVKSNVGEGSKFSFIIPSKLIKEN